MADPPQFVNYSSADGVPLTSSASKVTSRPAQFSRTSQRVNRLSNVQPQPDDEPLVNTAGVGSGNRPPHPNENLPARGANLSRASTRRQAPTANGNSNGPINGISPSSSPTANSRHPIGNGPMTSSTQNELVGGNSQQSGPRGPATSSHVGDETDPMVQALTNLRTGPGANIGRSGTRRVTAPDPSTTSGPSPVPPNKALTPPAPVSPNRNVDYRNSAEFVVGVHPAAQAPPSRSTSPVPPTANFMQPPAPAPAPVVDAVIDSYHQSFPGERRSRSNSRRASFNDQQPAVAPPPQGQGHPQGNLLERPVSRDGHPGIGANGRSRSPSINHPASRSTSPVPPAPARGGSVSRLDQGAGQGQYRATTPNSVGIALDPHGNVAMDAMADVYRQHQQQQQPVVQARQLQQAQAPPPMQPPPPAPAQYQQPAAQPQQQLQALGGAAARPAQQRQIAIGNNTYMPPTSWQTPAPAPPPQQYVPPPPTQQPPHHSPSYVQAPHPYANAPPSQAYHTSQPVYGMQQPPQPPQQQPRQPPQHAATGSNNGDYYSPTQTHQAYAQPHQQPRQQYPQHQHQQVAYGGGGYNRSLSPGPVNRSPSPQPMALTQPQPQPISEPPTRQYTEDGRGVLFYGAFFFLFLPSFLFFR